MSQTNSLKLMDPFPSWSISLMSSCSSNSDGAQPNVLITWPSSTEEMLPPPSLIIWSIMPCTNQLNVNLSKYENMSWYSSSFSFDKFAVAYNNILYIENLSCLCWSVEWSIKDFSFVIQENPIFWMIMSLLTCLISASRTCCSSSIVGLRSIINSAWQRVHNHRSDKRKCWKLPGCCPPVASQPAAWCLGPAPAPLLPALRAETPAPALSLVSLLRLRQRSESPPPHTSYIHTHN